MSKRNTRRKSQQQWREQYNSRSIYFLSNISKMPMYTRHEDNENTAKKKNPQAAKTTAAPRKKRIYIYKPKARDKFSAFFHTAERASSGAQNVIYEIRINLSTFSTAEKIKGSPRISNKQQPFVYRKLLRPPRL